MDENNYREISKKTKQKKEKKDNFIITFSKMFLSFIIVMMVTSTLSVLIFYNLKYNKYGDEFILELVWLLTVIIVLIVTKNTHILGKGKKNLWQSLKLGFPILIISFLSLIGSIASLNSFSSGSFINLLLYCLSIGLLEEFLCRGWLLNSFLKRGKDNKKSVIISIVASSLIFGLIHIINVGTTQGLIETTFQIIQATSLGILLGSIYCKTKNIWAVSLLHAFYDFSIFLGELNSIKDCITTDIVTKEVLMYMGYGSLILSFIYIISSLIIFKKSEIEEIKNENNAISNEDLIKENKKVANLWKCYILLFLLLFIPIPESSIKGYDEYRVCYNYNTKEINEYDLHYSNRKNYKMKFINDSNTSFSFSVFYNPDMNSLVLKNLITDESITLLEYYDLKYEVIENEDEYLIITAAIEEENPIVSYIKVKKSEMTNESSFLKKISSEIKKYYLPEIKNIGYITIENDTYSYPFIECNYGHNFVIDEKDNLYLIN